jgi:hypothetical protein
VRDGSRAACIFTKQISKKVRGTKLIEQPTQPDWRNSWKNVKPLLDKLAR